MRHSLAVFLLLTLTACSLFESKPDIDTTAKTSSVEEMYFTAKKSLDAGNYEDALKEFESLQSHYPYGRFAQQSQLEIAFIYYKQKEAESAISAADRSIVGERHNRLGVRHSRSAVPAGGATGAASAADGTAVGQCRDRARVR